MNKNIAQLFYNLTPNEILEGIEAVGFQTTGEYIQLNSFENRVFDIHLEKGKAPPELNNHLITKFYRPQRWSYEALTEEHNFLLELKAEGFPAIAPLILPNQTTLSQHNGIHFTTFPKGLGRLPQEFQLKDLELVGQSLALLHNIGARSKSQFRPTMTMQELGDPALASLEAWAAPEIWTRYKQASELVFDYLDDHLDPSSFIRIHGDLHRGNIIQSEFLQNDNWIKNFFFVDFDDFIMGPVAQDLWMLFSEEAHYEKELEAILNGYEKFRSFPQEQIKLFSALRALRIIRYGAWIAQRWSDPIFPQLFPQFRDYNYWAEEVEFLERLSQNF